MSGTDRSLRARWRHGSAHADLTFLVAVTLMAFVLRLAYVMIVQRHAFTFANDAFFYNFGATSLARHNSYLTISGSLTRNNKLISEPSVAWPPGFPFALSLVYRFTHENPFSGEVLNAVFGALTVPVLYVVAKRIFGRWEARIAAIVLAVFPGQILWTDVLVSETFYTLLLMSYLAVLVFARDTWKWVFIVGAMTAVIALTRGEGLYLLLIPLFVWSARSGWRKATGRIAVAAVVCAVGIAPWTLRNYSTTQKFIPVSANDGPTLYAGHNPAAIGSQSYPPKAVADQAHAEPGVKGQVEMSNFLRHQAIEYMIHNPQRELELIPLKILNLNRGDSFILEWVNKDGDTSHSPIGTKYIAPVKVIADFAYYALLATTLASVFCFRRRFWRDPVLRGVLAWFMFVIFLYGFVYYGNYRYRAPLEPLMILVSVPLIALLWRQRATLRMADEPDSQLRGAAAGQPSGETTGSLPGAGQRDHDPDRRPAHIPT